MNNTIGQTAERTEESAAAHAMPKPFGSQFMTTYGAQDPGFDPQSTRSNWTTNEDNNG
jgi:hypothetical protein